MTQKQLGFKAPAQLAIAVGATRPNPGAPGVIAWSTTLSTLVQWDGAAWNELVGGASNAATVVGEVTMFVTESLDYTITNYDSFKNYVVTLSAGTLTRDGAVLNITAPNTAQVITLSIQSDADTRLINITVIPAGIKTPSITSPLEENPTNDYFTITTTAFNPIGAADTHASTNWEIWTGAGRTGTLIYSSLVDTVNKTSIPVPSGMFTVSTTYHIVVSYAGTTLGTSGYAESRFTTKPVFSAYVATPTPTPTAYGDPLEGGFYSGMIWNEIAQTASTPPLTTGMITIVVPDMTTAPIVYGGQMVELRSRINPNNKMRGTIVSAVGTTIQIDVTTASGSAAVSDFSLMARFRIIVSPKAQGENNAVRFAADNFASPMAARSPSEGLRATLAMVAAGNASTWPAAHWCNNLVINGYSDWYLGSRDENELLWRYLKPFTTANSTTTERPLITYHYNGAFADIVSNHGTNRNAFPETTGYTAANLQVAEGKNFRELEPEALMSDRRVWNSTEYTTTITAGSGNNFLSYWWSNFPGYQAVEGKSAIYGVRAIRRSMI